MRNALLHTLHVSLLEGLREQRLHRRESERQAAAAAGFGDADKYGLVLHAVLADGEVTPYERQMVHEYQRHFRIQPGLHARLLALEGWDEQDWARGSLALAARAETASGGAAAGGDARAAAVAAAGAEHAAAATVALGVEDALNA